LARFDLRIDLKIPYPQLNGIIKPELFLGRS